MYKVFVNDRPLILEEVQGGELPGSGALFSLENLVDGLDALWLGTLGEIRFFTLDLERSWELLKGHFRIEEAGGGKVYNSNDDVLFIFRWGKWDLPKGKREPGEDLSVCALREVQEECGLKVVRLIAPLQQTYHVFRRNGAFTLKITHWFLMHTDAEEKPEPQVKEGIEKAVFLDRNSQIEALQNTYSNIRLLFPELAG
jgi:ADP-ribose pyrophosphatase YjhB (NUDIX family)